VFEGIREVVAAVAGGGFLFGLYQLLSRLFDLAKRPWSISLTWMIAMGVNLGLNVLLIPSYGVAGAAGATVLSYALSLGIATALRPDVVPLHIPLGRMALHGGCTAAVVWGAVSLMPDNQAGQIALAVAASVSVLVLAMVLKVVDHAAVKAEWTSR
jgi:O-antigen/teichoic acid export membrane protein